MKKLLFIGECRSLTAKRKHWTWKDGHLAAKPLFEALEAMGVNPQAHKYVNLWTDSMPPVIPYTRPKWLMMKALEGYVLVALGKRVSTELAKRGIVHVALVHPAARGRIRKTSRYRKHVRETLAPYVVS